ncbi:site-specific integrase [Mycolicibacterium aichiense]|uniref:site-specific integrase n=1 Tax=Mycolicibacterium aichiense TaxID=1799 RepID=UPI003D66F0B4
MAGRPSLRIGQHGKISRKYLGGGVWMARCRYRDTDGVTRIVERRGPADDYDKRGKLAEDALIEALAERRPPTGPDTVGPGSLVMALVDQHVDRKEQDGLAIRTIDTYRDDAKALRKFMAGVRVNEATPARLDAALRSMKNTHGATMARRARTLLRGGLQLAVLNNVLTTNPVRDVESIRSKSQPKGAVAISGEELRQLLTNLRTADECAKRDLVDPVTLLIATGLRRSELLALRWVDFDADAGTVAVTGKVVRKRGGGLVRVDETKTAAGRRVVALPSFAVTAILERRKLPYLGEQAVMFPSTAGTLRDPDNFNGQWRKVRAALGVPDVTSHSFRKTVATLVDDEGLSARIAADHLGHAKVSMTQDKYMSRGQVRPEVADLLERTVAAISDE